MVWSAQVVQVGEQRLPGLFLLPPSHEPPPLPPWVTDTSRSVADGENGTRIRYVFTDDQNGKAHIRDALLRAIGAARKKVLFCSFIFADEAIVDALCAAAERLRGGVYVLTELAKELVVTGKQGRLERQYQSLERLARAGVWLRGAEGCHAKFATVDDEIAVLTSANATKEAYEINPENGFVIEEPRIAREVGRLFARVWRRHTSLESAPGARIDVTRLPALAHEGWTPLDGASSPRAVCTLHDDEHSLRDATIAMLDGATHEVIACSYSAVGLTNHAVGQALRRALERHVRVLLVLRELNTNLDQSETCEWLVRDVPEAQHVLRGHPRNHAKAIVVDGKVSLVWSGNLDGHHGYDDGVETGIVAHDESIARVVRRYIVDLATRSRSIPRLTPTLAELADGQRQGGLRGRWRLRVPAEVIERMPPDYLRGLERDAVRISTQDERTILRIGDHALVLGRDDAAATLTVTDVLPSGAVAGPASFVGPCVFSVEMERGAPRRSPAQPSKRRRK